MNYGDPTPGGLLTQGFHDESLSVGAEVTLALGHEEG